MPSKLCPICFKVVSCNFVPNYCAWGCGSLKNEPLMPQFNSYEEQLEYIEQRKKEIIEGKKQEKIGCEIEPGKFQMRLF